VTLNQSTVECKLTVPSAQNIAKEGVSSKSLSLTSEWGSYQKDYTASSNQTRLTISTTSAGTYGSSIGPTSNTSFYIRVAENTGTSSRTAIITITQTTESSKAGCTQSKTITITQNGNGQVEVSCSGTAPDGDQTIKNTPSGKETFTQIN
jgi:hypothetical protein